MIEISHLTKKYGANVAVNDLSLTLEPGNIYGFLGPNGAGKSTTMNIITGYLSANSGAARIAGIDMEEHAKEMFNAGSNLRGKSVEEICFQDFKVFNVKDIMFGVGQITSMNQDELDEVKGRLIPYLEEARKTQGLHMLYLMMTNILEESTELLCCGENAKEQVLEAFELPGDTEKILLKGVVSRKKQMIPVLVTYLQQK